MTYATQEASVADGAPYFLYEFTDGTTYYRYTDYPENIDYGGNTFTATSIKHTTVKQSSEVSKNSVTVTTLLSNTIADQFIGWSPESKLSFTMFRGHFGAVDVLTYWKGRVVNHGLKDQWLELKCDSLHTAMKRPGLKPRYQRTCRHALYNSKCGVNKATYALAGTLSAASGTVLTIAEAAGEADGWFNGGILTLPDGSSRFIVDHVGDQVTILYPNRYIVDTTPSYAVTLYPGCDKTEATCITKFNNILPNGSFKYIPMINPMGGDSIV